MENRLIFDSHPSDDVFEEYAFERLFNPALAEFEEHLLLCPRCQDHLAKTDEYILLLKRATAEWHRAAPAPLPKASQAAFWRSSIAAVAGAGLITAALAIGIPHARPGREASSVNLVALRGTAGTMARARVGAPIEIVIDATDLDDRHHLRIQVVDAGGKPVWSGMASEPAVGNQVSARIETRLNAGVYWIRLYSAGGELLREFGLRTE